MPKIKEKLKNVLESWRRKKAPAHMKFLHHLPQEVQETEGGAASYYDFVMIRGTEEGPDGELGTYALANGKSGDIERYPLPRDPNDPKSVFLENGLAGMLKSVGEESKVVEVPGSGIWHLRKDSVVDARPAKDRPHPLQRWYDPTKPSEELPKPIEVTPRTAPMVEDLYDPNMPPRKGSILIAAKKLAPLHGVDVKVAKRLAAATTQAMGDLRSEQTKKNVEQHLAEIGDRVVNLVGQVDLLEADDRRLLAQSLSAQEAQDLLDKVELRVHSMNPNTASSGVEMKGWMRSHSSGVEIGISVVYVILDILQERTYLPLKQELYNAYRIVIAHELRHAIDWAEQESANPGSWVREHTSPEPGKPLLDDARAALPTEQKAAASNAALKLWQRWGKDYRVLSSSDLVETLKWVVPEIMRKLKPEHKSTFMEYVTHELDALAESEDAEKEGRRAQKVDTSKKEGVVSGHGDREEGLHGDSDRGFRIVCRDVQRERHSVKRVDDRRGSRDGSRRSRGGSSAPLGFGRDASGAITKRRDVVRILEDAGFHSDGGTKHERYSHPDGRWTVLSRGKVDLPPGQVRGIFRQALIDPRDYPVGKKQQKKDKGQSPAQEQVQRIGAARVSMFQALWPTISFDHLVRFASSRVASKLTDLQRKYPDFAEQIAQLAKADLSRTKKYLAWGARQLVNGEDVERIADVMAQFERIQARLTDKDINNYTLESAEAAIESVGDSVRVTRKTQKEEGSTIIAQTPEYTVRKLHTLDATCLYGSGTTWCITSRDVPWFETYTRQGAEIFIVLGADGRKYAVVSPPSTSEVRYEIYDEKNHRVGALPWRGAIEPILEAVQNSPILNEIERARVSNDREELRGLMVNGRFQLVVPLLNNPRAPDDAIPAMLSASPFGSLTEDYAEYIAQSIVSGTMSQLTRQGQQRFRSWALQNELKKFFMSSGQDEDDQDSDELVENDEASWDDEPEELEEPEESKEPEEPEELVSSLSKQRPQQPQLDEDQISTNSTPPRVRNASLIIRAR